MAPLDKEAMNEPSCKDDAGFRIPVFDAVGHQSRHHQVSVDIFEPVPVSDKSESGGIISVQNLTKIYRLYTSPVDRLKESLHPLRPKCHEEHYALNNVSFEIMKGEAIGIVGRNGSGKSTLLKLLTGVVTPTSGALRVKGKISALLELGAGFNPELTGLENAYFNGMMMGYSRKEMDEKLDDILSFADIGHFIYQPVKIYSSGMFVRLAFAVAISMEPEILIIDEALAVGDEAFQRKCFSRILAIQEQGGTILVVSHSPSMILQLCNRAILLDQGELLLSGLPKLVISRYQKLVSAPKDKVDNIRRGLKELATSLNLENFSQSICGETLSSEEQQNFFPENEATNDDFFDANLMPQSTVCYEPSGAIISNPMILTKSGKQVNLLIHDEEYEYTFTAYFEKDAYNVRFGTMFKTSTGFELGGMVSHIKSDSIPFIRGGSVIQPRFCFHCSLLPGVYFMNAGVVGYIDETEIPLHRVIDACIFRVQTEPDMLVNGIVDFSCRTSNQ